MRNSKTKKLTALVLALALLIGSAVTTFAADGDGSSGAASDSSSDTLTELGTDYALINYESYKSKYNYSTDMRTGENVTIPATDYVTDPEVTTADVEEATVDGTDCILVGEGGSVSWKVDVPKAGWYCVSFKYRAENEKTTDIERIFKLNGKTPYSEARYQDFNKVWSFKYATDDVSDRDNVFEVDASGNELRPDAYLSQEWITHSVKDNDGYYRDPLEFWFEEGENTVTLDGVRDKAYFAEISVYSYEELPTYEKVLAEYGKKGYESADADTVYFEAETPAQVSNYTVYPVYDRASAITSPQHKSKIYRNTMGGDKWVTNGQWIRYEFECEASGLYEIGIRFAQDQLKGMYTSRAVRIDGEYPFEEAKDCQFPYDNKWQVRNLGDGNNDFQFYLEKGRHTIELEVGLGSLADVVRQVNSVVDSLNDDYLRIVELTGADPDEYRDYGFTRSMPTVVADLGVQSSILYQLVDYISEINGIKSDNTSTLEQAAVLVEKMSSDEKEIAANLSSLKEWVSSLGTWLSDVTTQYLEMDYIIVQPAGSSLPKGEANGWQAFWFEIQKFIASFYTDYNAIGEDGAKSEKTIEVWTTSGRDQAQIIKNLVNNGYTPEYNTNVNIKLVAAGTLLPAILAGVGPDASIDATNPIDMAIRGAVLPLNDYDTFDEVMSRFADSAKTPLSLYGTTYAVPVSQTFPVLFCRNDILSDLGLSVPETWDDLMSMVPILQFNNMEIGMTQDFTVFLYQAGGQYWRDEGMSIGFDDYKALDTFEYMCNMFTQYSLPISYSAENRFKTGEIPVLISAYSFYNTLVVFAPEIAGLWSFYEIPGTRNEETGEVDHTSVSAITGIIIPRGTSDDEAAWTFLDWYSDKDFQVDYSDEMMALLGPSAKQQVANLDAFEELPWSESEAATLHKCINHTVAIEAYPGNYYVSRYSSFAFNAAYNEKEDPSDQLLSYVDTINKELTRKRKEFNLMINDEWQAIKDYMGFESFNEWKEYWAELEGVDPDSNTTYIQDNRDGAKEYTYVNWMSDNKITVDSHTKWQNAVKYDGETCTYKEWVEKK